LQKKQDEINRVEKIGKNVIEKINKIVPITDGHYVPTFRTVQGRANIYSHIEKLLEDPRAKIDDIAKATDFSSKTITRSIDKLQNDEAILFSLIYNPEKLSGYVPYAILVWVDGDLNSVLKSVEKKFSDSFLQKPFIAKNQIVLFMYSDNIFKLDDLTQKVRDINGVKFADLFIPKKINLPTKWISDSIKSSKSSKKLHLVYQTH
jgi:DNA-binding Lrp family transcriptional regulator